MSRKNIIRLSLGIFLLFSFTAACIIFPYYRSIYAEGVPQKLDSPYVHIPTGSTFEDVVYILKSGRYITDEASFRWVAERMNYKRPVMRAGRFEIKPGWSNRDLISHLRAGEQSPVQLVLNNERLPEDIAGKSARFLEADSMAILEAMYDPENMQKYNYTKETLVALFIPNTYEMYWNASPDAFLERMVKENKAFWSKNNRAAKAEALGLSKAEVCTVASIIERETNVNAEKERMAGVYLNRLNTGMKLQADPTCVFASKDFTTTRVTEYHLNYDSPYNTYLYAGLPPGPICMSSIASIDAVLNREKHDYIYFCAKPDLSGTHAFAVTYSAHLVNVDKLRAFMRTQGK